MTMRKHTTHFDDCGCKSGKLESEIQSLREKLDQCQGELKDTIVGWSKAEDRAESLREKLAMANKCQVCGGTDVVCAKGEEEHREMLMGRLESATSRVRELESLVLAQSLAINESIEILINTSNGFIPTPTWDRINDFLDKPKPSPELGAKIAETLEKAKSNCGYIERTLPVMVKQMGEEYGKFLPNLLKEIISQSEDLLRLIRETGSNSK
jgi:hypothetical protein